MCKCNAKSSPKTLLFMQNAVNDDNLKKSIDVLLSYNSSSGCIFVHAKQYFFNTLQRKYFLFRLYCTQFTLCFASALNVVGDFERFCTYSVGKSKFNIRLLRVKRKKLINVCRNKDFFYCICGLRRSILLEATIK